MSAVTAELLADHVKRFVLAGPDALVFAPTRMGHSTINATLDEAIATSFGERLRDASGGRGGGAGSGGAQPATEL